MTVALKATRRRGPVQTLRGTVILGIRPLEEVGIAVLNTVVQSIVQCVRRGCLGRRFVLGDRCERFHLVHERLFSIR